MSTAPPQNAAQLAREVGLANARWDEADEVERTAQIERLLKISKRPDAMQLLAAATAAQHDELLRQRSAGMNPHEVASIRHLLYHVCPFAASDAWRKNVAQIVRRIDLFNGRRCVAIATGEGMTEPAEVRAAFGGAIHRFLELPNCKTLREQASFIPLMELVESTDPREATFYAHAKGVATIGDREGVMFWRNLMYHALLDDLDLVRRSLATFPIVGTHRKQGDVIYPDGIASSPWHFSGTYFWFRNRDVFAAPWREALQASGWGVEAWPGRMFALHESCCLALDGVVNPYDPATYQGADRIFDDDGPGASAALKIEIGGGHFPKGDGFLNVDQLDCADVQVDLEQLGRDASLPFADDSVQHIYSSHCFEHIVNLKGLLHELVRVAALGCLVEIRVPHWLSNMANCHDHKQTISHEQIDHWTRSALGYWWSGCKKRWKLLHVEHVRGAAFAEWKQLLPHATDDQILRLCPDACHESRYTMTVVPNGG